MLTKYNEKPLSKAGVSCTLTSIVAKSDYARLKIVHDENFDPFAYAIGFGCKTNSSLLIGGTSDNDEFSSSLLIAFAKTLCDSLAKNDMLLGIDLRQLFFKKGLWIIPDYKLAKSDVAFNFISEKLNPKRIMELNLGKESLKYNFGKRTPVNSKLLAYLLASSCGYNIDMNENEVENNLCSWFSKEFSRPSYSLSIGNEQELPSADIETVLDKLLEAFIIFIAA